MTDDVHEKEVATKKSRLKPSFYLILSLPTAEDTVQNLWSAPIIEFSDTQEHFVELCYMAPPKTFGPEHSFSHTCLRFAGISFSCRVPHCCPQTLQVPETSVNMSEQHHIQLLLSYSPTHLETPPGRC